MPNWTGDDGVSDYKAADATAASLLSDEWRTPPEVFDPLHAEHKFTVDAAANELNHLLRDWYGPGGLHTDSLSVQWRGNVWVNPPFSNIEPWVAHAWVTVSPSAGPFRPACIVMILPANRTEQDWWRKYVEPWRDGRQAALLAEGGITFSVEFLHKRVYFIPPPGVKASSPRFGCCLLRWVMHNG